MAGDPLRAVGSLGVLTYHAAFIAIFVIGAGPTQGFIAFGQVGHVMSVLELGVPMFFAMSAFLIGRPFIDAVVFGDRPPGARGYARRRFLRIVPIFWFITALILLRYGLRTSPVSDAVAIFAFVQTYHGSLVQDPIGQAWTLDVEVAFYFLVPIGAWLFATASRRMTPERRLVGLLTLLTTLFLASIYIRGHGPSGAWWLDAPPAMLCSFIPGLMLAAIEIPLRPWVTEHRDQARKLALLVGAASVACALVYIKLGAPTGYPILLRELTGGRVFYELVSVGLLIQGLLIWQWSGSGTPRVLNMRWEHWLGERTLSFYLIHQAVLMEILPIIRRQHSVWAGWGINVAIALPVTLALAAVTYRLVERPAMNLKRTKPQPIEVVDSQANAARELLATYENEDEGAREAHLAESERSA